MTIQALLDQIIHIDQLNFWLTNRVPRRKLTRLVGWLSRVEQPLVRDVSLAVWKLFTRLDLHDAAEARFASLHDVFTRRLRDGARPVATHPALLASPCDAIVVASGIVAQGRLLQVKGSFYPLAELLDDPAHAAALEGAHYVTLRLTSAMYHRFHAPHDCTLTAVTYIPGDCWNVNPPTLARVPSLYCRNERAVLRTRLDSGGEVTLVAVAAILVAGIRLHCLALPMDAGCAPCAARLRKGEEMGWFEHGSTIVMIAPPGAAPCEGMQQGAIVQAGQALLIMHDEG